VEPLHKQSNVWQHYQHAATTIPALNSLQFIASFIPHRISFLLSQVFVEQGTAACGGTLSIYVVA
jgi:hypothetical protein